MQISKSRVLVDGFNLEMPQGAGLARYGWGVVRALKELGADVSILLSCGRHRDPRVQEALAFDARRVHAPWPLLALQALRALTVGAPARRLTRSDSVILSPQDAARWAVPDRLCVSPDCYSLAWALHKWTGVGLTQRVEDGVDAWHTTYPLPIEVRGARRVSLIADLIPLKLPFATLDDKAAFHRAVLHTIQTSDVVTVLSEATRQDLVEYFRVDPARVVVTYAPVTSARRAFDERDLATRLALLGLERGQYLLYLGTIEPRKNLLRLMRATAGIAGPSMPLVIVGMTGWLCDREMALATALVERGSVVLAGYVADEDAQALYAGARALLFPSLYEGLGLPPIEAMLHGCPVVTSNVSSLPEICGDAALYCDPYDVDDIADKIRQVVGDEGLRNELRDKGLRRAEFFGMENFKKRLAEAYDRVA